MIPPINGSKMNQRYSFVPLVKGIQPEDYRDVLAAALVLANETTKEENILKDPAKIKVIEQRWTRWEGKFFPGGQSTMWAMRFSLKTIPETQIIKCFYKLNPYLLVNHVASVDKFLQDFPSPIQVKGKKYLIKPAKNIALARIEGEDQFVFHVQQFSPGSIIPPSVPIAEICIVISAKGYVVDAYPRNWRLNTFQAAPSLIIEYIDEVFWNNIYQQQDPIQTLSSQLDKFQYPL